MRLWHYHADPAVLPLRDRWRCFALIDGRVVEYTHATIEPGPIAGAVYLGTGLHVRSERWQPQESLGIDLTGPANGSR